MSLHGKAQVERLQAAEFVLFLLNRAHSHTIWGYFHWPELPVYKDSTILQV